MYLSEALCFKSGVPIKFCFHWIPSSSHFGLFLLKTQVLIAAFTPNLQNIITPKLLQLKQFFFSDKVVELVSEECVINKATPSSFDLRPPNITKSLKFT